jgi:hypothetical protein
VRLYPELRAMVNVTLVESRRILDSFDARLRTFAEKKLASRQNFTMLHSSVTSECVCEQSMPAAHLQKWKRTPSCWTVRREYRAALSYGRRDSRRARSLQKWTTCSVIVPAR